MSACHRASEAELIIGTVDSIARALEERNLAGAMERVSSAYRDFEDRDRTGLENLVMDYFNRYRGIIINVLGKRLILENDALEGEVEGDAVVSSGVAAALRKTVRFYGEYYRFRLILRPENGIWRVVYSEWRPAGLNELLPQSAGKVKELFPEF